MKKEDKWIQEMRKCLEDYSESLPPHLWEKMERELSAPKVIPIWRKWQVAAAVLALAISSLTIWFWSSPSAQYIQTSAIPQKSFNSNTEVHKPSSVTNQESILPKSNEYLAQERTAATSISSSQLPFSTIEKEYPDTAALTQKAMDKEEEEVCIQENKNNASQEEENKQIIRKKIAATDKKQMQHNQLLAQNKEMAHKKQSWSVGLTTGNIPYSTSSSFGGFARLDSRSLSTEALHSTNKAEMAYSQVLLNNREQTTQTDIHHRMPVTIGVSVKWNLNEQWAVESGLTYTFLSSELHSGSNSYVEEEQKLHYIGIPLKVHRSIWKNKYFNFYASAGGMVEKCISGEQEVTYAYGTNSREKEMRSLDITSLQWSVMAAIGAQVDITSLLGFYIEPGMSYYFDDGNNIETIRKQHPLNFNLQLGFRLNINR